MIIESLLIKILKCWVYIYIYLIYIVVVVYIYNQNNNHFCHSGPTSLFRLDVLTQFLQEQFSLRSSVTICLMFFCRFSFGGGIE